MITSPLPDTSSKRAQKALLKICLSLNPNAYGAPFRDNGWPRYLLYPYSFEPKGIFRETLVKIAKAEANSFLYVKLRLAESGQVYDYQPFWHLALDDIGDIMGKIIPDENVLFSPSADWAVVSSGDHHALFTCAPKYQGFAENAIPDQVAAKRSFLAFWSENKVRYDSDISWIPETLRHIGQE